MFIPTLDPASSTFAVFIAVFGFTAIAALLVILTAFWKNYPPINIKKWQVRLSQILK